MARNGSGVYTPPGTDFPAVSGTTIESTKFNNTINDIATGLTESIARDGQTTVTANIPMSGYKLTGVGAATARTDAASIATIQDGTGVYVASVGGTGDAITLTPSPAITAYATGQKFTFVAAATNTGATTVAISGLAAKSIKTNGGANNPRILSGELVTIRYTGTNFILEAQTQNAPLALAGNTTLGNAHNQRIIQVSGVGVTLTLTDAATLGAGWYCDIVSTDTTNSVTLARATVGDTIEGTASNYSIFPGEKLRVFVVSAANGFRLIGNRVLTSAFSANSGLSGSAALILTSTSATAENGPYLALFRDSASPAASDGIGTIALIGRDSAGNEEAYGYIYGTIDDPTSTSEDSTIRIFSKSAGAGGSVAFSGSRMTAGTVPFPRNGVILDTPELIASGSASVGWTTVNNTTLNNALATVAILRIAASAYQSATTSSISCYFRKTGSGIAATGITEKAYAYANVTAETDRTISTCFVPLDTNSDFDYNIAVVNNASYSIYLDGYYY